jgi:hypothetical protein
MVSKKHFNFLTMYKQFSPQNRLSLQQRLLAPVPKFFKKLRTIGIILTAIGTSLLASEAILPVSVTNIAGYLVTAGSVIIAVCSTTVDYQELDAKKDLK